MRKLLALLVLSTFAAPLHAEKPDPIRVECEAALQEPLQDMLESALAVEDTLTAEEYERLVASIEATHEGNVDLCVVGRKYFLSLAPRA